MEEKKLRVIDILKNQEKKDIEECEKNIISARTPIAVIRNKNRAIRIMEDPIKRGSEES